MGFLGPIINTSVFSEFSSKKLLVIQFFILTMHSVVYSQVHKYWDIDTILTFLALYTTTMDFKSNEQDVL